MEKAWIYIFLLFDFTKFNMMLCRSTGKFSIFRIFAEILRNSPPLRYLNHLANSRNIRFWSQILTEWFVQGENIYSCCNSANKSHRRVLLLFYCVLQLLGKWVCSDKLLELCELRWVALSCVRCATQIVVCFIARVDFVCTAVVMFLSDCFHHLA